MLKGWRIAFILLGLFITTSHILAEAACPSLVQQALDTVSTSCQSIGRNQACYGNISLSATPRSSAVSFTFDSVGDIVDVTQLKTLKLDALDEARGIWGLAMMQLQADIPDSLPGQSVTFLVFGDVELENQSAEGQPPMQAFYMRTGVGASTCRDVPDSGLLIQTPHGVESVHFNINGVSVEIGSTVMLQAQPAGELTIQTLEGAAVVTMEGQSYPVIAGTQMSLPLDINLHPAGLPQAPVPLTDTGINNLPIAPLPRQIVPAAPLSEPVMTKLQMRLEAGLEPCGVPGLPACEHALTPQADRIWTVTGAQNAIDDTAAPVIEDIIVPVIENTAVPIIAGNPVLEAVPTLDVSTWEEPVYVAPSNSGSNPVVQTGGENGLGSIVQQSMDVVPAVVDNAPSVSSPPSDSSNAGAPPVNPGNENAGAPPSNPGNGNAAPPPSPPGQEKDKGKDKDKDHGRGHGHGHDHHDHDDDDD